MVSTTRGCDLVLTAVDSLHHGQQASGLDLALRGRSEAPRERERMMMRRVVSGEAAYRARPHGVRSLQLGLSGEVERYLGRVDGSAVAAFAVRSSSLRKIKNLFSLLGLPLKRCRRKC